MEQIDKERKAARAAERELLERIKGGDMSAYDGLVRQHSAKMYTVAYGLLSDRMDAEEVVQDAFVRAFRALGKFRGDASFGTWLTRIVVNLSRNRYQWNRRRGAEVNVSLSAVKPGREQDSVNEDAAIPDESASPDKIISGVELEGVIAKGMSRLPEKLRETMILRHVEEMSYDDIAETLDCKIGTVKSRLARGREILRKYIDSV